MDLTPGGICAATRYLLVTPLPNYQDALKHYAPFLTRGQSAITAIISDKTATAASVLLHFTR
jgi:hypothetical protein